MRRSCVVFGSCIVRTRPPAASALGRTPLPRSADPPLSPVLLGGGPRLFDDGLPAGRWTLVGQTAGDHGTLALVYDRVR